MRTMGWNPLMKRKRRTHTDSILQNYVGKGESNYFPTSWPKQSHQLLSVRTTLPSALNVMNASSAGKLVQLVTASRLTYITKDKSIQWRMSATTK